MKMRNEHPIVVAGGGIGGLACALALAQRSFRVVVCEQAAAFGQVGAGLQVAPNALSVLDALGVGAEIKDSALLIERMVLADGISGDEICNIACGTTFIERFGNPYAVAHRADVHGALLTACRASSAISLRTDSRIIDYTKAPNGITAVLETGGTLFGVALVGADGIRSRIREKIIGDGDPLSANAVIYRALVPAEAMPRHLQHPFPTLLAGPRAHLIFYPVRGWREFNVAATVLKPTDGVEEAKTDQIEALAAFQDWSSTAKAVLNLSGSYQRYIIRHREPTSMWSDGNATLLGDAAHPMVQYIAQGAAMALEDAICLADQADMSDGDFDAAFSAYQRIRLIRAGRMQISSLMLDRLYHCGGAEQEIRNGTLASRSTDEHYEKLDWIFRAPDYVDRWNSHKNMESVRFF